MICVSGEEGDAFRVATEVLDVKFQRKIKLLDVVPAVDGVRRVFGARESGQKQRGENGDDRDDDEQLDEREGPR